MDATPENVHLKQREGVLEIDWDDGRHSRFSLRYLRGWCPCALCQGHLHGVTKFVDHPAPRLLGAEPVGTYAMRLQWADGHQTGIYAFRYLRAIEDKPPAEGPTNGELLAEAAAPEPGA